jgi:hypothetical protein
MLATTSPFQPSHCHPATATPTATAATATPPRNLLHQLPVVRLCSRERIPDLAHAVPKAGEFGVVPPALLFQLLGSGLNRGK